MPTRPARDPADSDDAVPALAELVGRARDMADRLRAGSSDPLVHAGGEALAAAHALMTMSVSPGPCAGQDQAARLDEVLASVRAAGLAVAFAVVEERQRSRHRG